MSLVGFFSSTMEINGSKQHPIVPFTMSTRFKDLVLTLVIYHTPLLIDAIILHKRKNIFTGMHTYIENSLESIMKLIKKRKRLARSDSIRFWKLSSALMRKEQHNTIKSENSNLPFYCLLYLYIFTVVKYL